MKGATLTSRFRISIAKAVRELEQLVGIARDARTDGLLEWRARRTTDG